MKVCFAQNTPNAPSGITSWEGDKGRKMPKMNNLASTGLRISASLDNKPKQKYGLFYKFSLSVVGACDADNPHTHIYN